MNLDDSCFYSAKRRPRLRDARHLVVRRHAVPLQTHSGPSHRQGEVKSQQRKEVQEPLSFCLVFMTRVIEQNCCYYDQREEGKERVSFRTHWFASLSKSNVVIFWNQIRMLK